MNDEKRCRFCGVITEDQDLERRTETERVPLGERTVTEPLVYLSCPICGSDDLVDYWRCVGCNKAEALQGDDYCRECRGILEAGA